MSIILLIIIIIWLYYLISKPINKSSNFDISLSQKAYQHKIEKYLENKFNLNKQYFKIKTNKQKIFFQKEKNLKLNNKKLKTYKFNGYLRFKNSGIYVHRWVMEKHLKRKLTNEEVVHHKDGNKLNNNIENLILFPNQKIHHLYHQECLKKYKNWHANIPPYLIFNKLKKNIYS